MVGFNDDDEQNHHDSFDIDELGNIHTGQRGASSGNSTYKRITAPANQVSDYNSSLDKSFNFYGELNSFSIHFKPSSFNF